MSETPFITVIILCYNRARFVQKAVSAVAAQTFRDFNLLFIDNGSTDESLSIYEGEIQKYPEMRTECLVIEKNQGPTHGWNEGLQVARGEYVIFNDVDDWMEPECLSELAEKAVQTGADRVTGQYREVDAENRQLRVRKIISDKNAKLPTAMLQGTLFRRRVFTENGIRFPEHGNPVAYDFEIVYRFAAAENKNGVVVQKTLYNYLVHSGSVIQSYISADKARYEFEMTTVPLIKMTSEVIKSCQDIDLANRMEYLVIRNYYPKVISLFQTQKLETSKKIYQEMRTLMEKKLPNYRRNPFLRPFMNGYEQPGSLVDWALCLLESINLLQFIARIGAKWFRRTKFFR